MSRLALLVVVLFLTPPLTSSSPAATACATQILRDWSADGRVTKTYALPCYEEAIDALPTDIRDYTNAEDVITRALSSAVRSDDSTGAASKPVETSEGTLLPVPQRTANVCVMLYECGCNAGCTRVDRTMDALSLGKQVVVTSGPLNGTRVFVARQQTGSGESVFTVQRADPSSPIQVCGSPRSSLIGYGCSVKDSGRARACMTCE